MNIVVSRSIDLLRVFSILFVLILHSKTNLNFSVGWVSALSDIVSNGLGALGVPIFFMVSGYLAGFKHTNGARADSLSSWGRRAGGLLTVYIFWNTLVALLALVIIHSGLSLGSFLTTKLAGGFLGIYGLDSEFPIAYQFWFIRELIIFSALFFIIDRIIMIYHNFYYFVILFAFIIFFMAMSERTQISAIVYTAGYLAGRNDVVLRIMLSPYKHRVWLAVLGGAAFISLIMSTVMKVWIEISLLSFVLSGALFMIWSVIGIVSKGYRMNAIARWAPATFFIFAAHEPFLALVRKMLAAKFGSEISYIISPTLVLASLLVFFMLIPQAVKVKMWFIFSGSPPKSA